MSGMRQTKQSSSPGPFVGKTGGSDVYGVRRTSFIPYGTREFLINSFTSLDFPLTSSIMGEFTVFGYGGLDGDGDTGTLELTLKLLSGNGTVFLIPFSNFSAANGQRRFGVFNFSIVRYTENGDIYLYVSSRINGVLTENITFYRNNPPLFPLNQTLNVSLIGTSYGLGSNVEFNVLSGCVKVTDNVNSWS